VVCPHGGLWRASAAVANHQTMPQRWPWVARGRMQPLQGAGKSAARRHTPAARHADMEAGSLAEMPVMPDKTSRATSPHDQADRGARDHALQVGASGGGAVKGRRAARQEMPSPPALRPKPSRSGLRPFNPQLKSTVLQIQSDRREVASNSQRSALSHPADSDR
jgi:hypothetical protein